MPQVEKELLASNSGRVRGGNQHPANKARYQGLQYPAQRSKVFVSKVKAKFPEE